MVASHSPYVVRLLHAFQTREELILVMPCYTGGDVHSALMASQRLSEDIVRLCAAEIILAMEHIHSLFYVYRDIKPLNLLIDADGHIAVTDYGLCRPLEEDHHYSIVGRGGTRGYRSPEAAAGHAYDFSCDFYSLGITLYEMVTGRRKAQSLHPGVPNTPNDLKTNARLSREFKDLIRRLTLPNPCDRLGCELSCMRMVERCVRLGLPHNDFTAPAPPRVYPPLTNSGFSGMVDLGVTTAGGVCRSCGCTGGHNNSGGGYANSGFATPYTPGGGLSGLGVTGSGSVTGGPPLRASMTPGLAHTTQEEDPALGLGANGNNGNFTGSNTGHAQSLHGGHNNSNIAAQPSPRRGGSGVTANGQQQQQQQRMLWSCDDDGARSPGPDLMGSCACPCHNNNINNGQYQQHMQQQQQQQQYYQGPPAFSVGLPPHLDRALPHTFTAVKVPVAVADEGHWIGHGHVRGYGNVPGMAQIYHIHPATDVPLQQVSPTFPAALGAGAGSDRSIPAAVAGPASSAQQAVQRAARALNLEGFSAVPVYQVACTAPMNDNLAAVATAAGPHAVLAPRAIPVAVPCGCPACAGCRCEACAELVRKGRSLTVPEVDSLEDLDQAAALAAAAAGVVLAHTLVTTTTAAGPITVEVVPSTPSPSRGVFGTAAHYPGQFTLLDAHRSQLLQAAT
mgnify:FL=1